MTYQGPSRHNKWIFETLSGHSRLVALVGHNPPSSIRILRGVIPVQPPVPALFFTDVNPRPIVGVTNELIQNKVQFSVLAPHAGHDILDEAQRILRELFKPEDYPNTMLGGTLRVLYVELAMEGGAIYEDAPRRCLRMDQRFVFGLTEL